MRVLLKEGKLDPLQRGSPLQVSNLLSPFLTRSTSLFLLLSVPLFQKSTWITPVETGHLSKEVISSLLRPSDLLRLPQHSRGTFFRKRKKWGLSPKLRKHESFSQGRET